MGQTQRNFAQHLPECLCAAELLARLPVGPHAPCKQELLSAGVQLGSTKRLTITCRTAAATAAVPQDARFVTASARRRNMACAASALLAAHAQRPTRSRPPYPQDASCPPVPLFLYLQVPEMLQAGTARRARTATPTPTEADDAVELALCRATKLQTGVSGL